MSKIDHSLFSAHEHALDDNFGDCPECGKPLHIKNSKSGPFIGCTGYPECSFSKPLHDKQTTILKTLDGVACPECASDLAIKKGRFGMFIGCTNFPSCHHIEPIKEKEDTLVDCPKCKKGHLISRTNKYGKHFPLQRRFNKLLLQFYMKKTMREEQARQKQPRVLRSMEEQRTKRIKDDR